MLTVTRTNLVDSHGLKKSSLSEITLFKNIPPRVLCEIEKQVIEKNYARGECIFMEDDRADYVWFVKEGHVKLGHHAMDGHSQTFCIKGPLGMFGVAALGEGDYGVYSMAETDAMVLSLPVPVFQAIMGHYPAIAKAMVCHISMVLRQAKEMEMISTASAEKRLLHALLELAGEYGTTIPLTRREISEMAGTSVETCIRIFSRLEKERFISSTHGRLTIQNVENLKKKLGEL